MGGLQGLQCYSRWAGFARHCKWTLASDLFSTRPCRPKQIQGSKREPHMFFQGFVAGHACFKVQASKDCGEGVPRLGIEESFLSSCSMCQSPVCCPWKKHAECASGVVLGSSCALSLYIMRSR